MGYKDSTAFTVQGVKNIYYSLLFAIPFCIVIFLSATFFYAPGFIAAFIAGIVFTLIFFIKGMGDMLNGREEISEKHATNVILASVLSSISIILFLFLIILAMISSSIFMSFTWIDDPLPFIVASILISIMSIAFMIFIGLGLILYILEIIPADKKKFLWISFGLLIAFPIISTVIVSFSVIYCLVSAIVFILPMFLFIICYKSVYERLRASDIKAVPLIPCPFCEHVIPANSTSCRHCGTKFEKEIEEELDPRLSMDIPKPYREPAPYGYTPVEGPTEHQKKRVKMIISLIVVLIVVAAGLFIIFSKSDTERFIGVWRMDSSEEISSEFGEDISTIQWVLCKNGSMKFSYIDKNGFEIQSSISWGLWGVKDNKLYNFDPSTQTGSLYETKGVNYKFSNNDKSFEVEFEVLGSIIKVTFNKID